MQISDDHKYVQMYDNISTVYEGALTAHHKHAQIVLNRLNSIFLKPRSRILDIACGTGKPVSAYFASNGHEVTGIDYSPKMLELARIAVPNATFFQAEMFSWEPPEGRQYDLVAASHCFYNVSVTQVKTMIYKLSLWAKKDGIVVIGMSYIPEVLEREGVLGQRGWAEGFPCNFLGQEFETSSMGHDEAWANLIKSTGLDIIEIDRENCTLGDGSCTEVQFYIVTRRTQANPLLGPFPLPASIDGPANIQPEVWRELSEKKEIDKAYQAICETLHKGPSCHKVLCVSKLNTVPHIPNIEIQQTSELPSSNVQPGSFDCVLLNWILHLVSSPEDYIDNAIKAISPTGNGKVIVIQSTPDNELVNLINKASEGLGLPIQHHGFLLSEAENKLRASGFQNINYIRTQASIQTFCSLQGQERIDSAANILSRVFTADESLQEQLKERLKNLLKVHFSFKSSGEITCQGAILVAERE
ncbi:hypothetical protein Clacol_008110 [Clathrus columnatus]|uniref:Methyltransferase domain-containing protein n=1 Tax=Clathrus columnatus TaxID=1419009 RepID=A0AAV5AL86_9AGAM|nr:hypothetical protein Clacol_008110 [Clathrus columnatus]